MKTETLKRKIEYFSYMAKNWKNEDVEVIEKDVVLDLLTQFKVKSNDTSIKDYQKPLTLKQEIKEYIPGALLFVLLAFLTIISVSFILKAIL